MKLKLFILVVLLFRLAAIGYPGNKIVIKGKIEGEIPGKVEYTNPIHGICNGWFTRSVVPDSTGKFQISLVSEETVFVKIRTSFDRSGIIIASPGSTYDVLLNVKDKDHFMTVTGKSAALQKAYNLLPHPEHIQLGAREYFRDTVAVRVKESIMQKKREEIGVFEKLRSDRIISRDEFNLVKTDRECYYDAVQATVAWLKDLMVMQGREKSFPDDFENLWKETFQTPLFSKPELVKSPMFNFYAECYIYFQEYRKGDFTKEKYDALGQTNQMKKYRIDKAKEFLPPVIREDYIAHYLYDESIQKKYEKELIQLFEEFRKDYPGSDYLPYISPLIEEVVSFQKKAEGGFSDNMNFVDGYSHLNTPADIVGKLPRGKTYVDVWATWCGPCKAEFEFRAKLQELLHKKGIQMLYISLDRDQDSMQWKNMIKFYNLEGYHVRAGKGLDAELRRIYDRNGSVAIPWYMLFDHEGRILVKHAESPSSYDNLEKQLNEN
jgi:thiol-disulfide isomerase/thioredoxin